MKLISAVFISRNQMKMTENVKILGHFDVSDNKSGDITQSLFAVQVVIRLH
jgi:hypothetical protein